MTARLRWLLLLLGIAISLFGPVTHAHESSTSADTLSPPLILYNDEVTARFAGHLDYLEDARHNLDANAVLALPVHRWQPIANDVPSFGFVPSTFWFRTAIENQRSSSSPLVLNISYPPLDHLVVHEISNGRIIASHRFGDIQVFSQRDIINRNYLTELHLAPGERRELLIEVQTSGSVQLPMKLTDKKRFDVDEQFYLLGQGLYLGILFVMTAYNLFIFLAVRDIAYVYYGLCVASFGLFQAALHGLAFQFLWPDSPWLNSFAISFFLAAFAGTACLFAGRLLNLRHHHRVYHHIVNAMATVMLAIMVSSVVIDYSISIKLAVFFGIPICIVAFVLGGDLWRRGHREVRYFLLAWTCFILGMIVLALNKFGVLPQNTLTEYGIQGGHVLEVILLSFALADRINLERREKFEAQQRALEHERVARAEQEKYLQLTLIKAQDDLRSRQKIIEVEAESNAKSRFLATMSHEIRTPMNGVLGMAELLQTTELAPQQRFYVDVIDSSGKALLNIINDILDFSRIEAGKMELDFIDFDLDKLCLDVASMFSITAEKKSLELICSIEPGTPVFVRGDPVRVRQILLNLMGNAFKFTNEGGISLRILRVPESIEHNRFMLRFEIRDSGIGLTEEQMERLFKPFSQADNSTTRKFGGSGLGLSISRHLAELMGGEIGVTSQPGRGSTFWFTLRCAEATQQFIREHYVPVSLLKGRKLLIVDDSAEFTHTIREQAESWGMRTRIAYFGEQALQYMREAAIAGEPFDLVSLDMNMPGMNGLELSQHMQADPLLCNTTRLLLTAMRITPPKAALDRSGITLAIQKPASARRLKETFLGLLGQTCDRTDMPSRDDEHRAALSTLRILVAEDNGVNQTVIRSMLKNLGVTQVVIAANGREALTCFEDQTTLPFNAVLMDCEMPELDGYEATRAMRKFEATTGRTPCPIIALTAHVLHEHIAQCQAAGMNDQLGKPLELKALRDMLIAHLIESRTGLTG